MQVESTLQAENKLIDMQRTFALSRWDELLEAQTDVFFPHEIEFFLSNPLWLNARSILDVGCGNGYYLAKLRSFFPEKSYTGIDISPRLVEIAHGNQAASGIEFESTDFFDYQPHRQHDVILMRLIVQHMTGIENILDHADGLLSPNGCLIVTEPNPEHFANRPQTPLFEGLLQTVKNHAAHLSRNKGDLSHLASCFTAVPGWKLRGHIRRTVPHTGPFANTRLHRMLRLWVDILEGAGEIDHPFEDTRRELDAWSQVQTAYNQIGVQFLVLQRTD